MADREKTKEQAVMEEMPNTLEPKTKEPEMPRVSGTLRAHAIKVPEVAWKAKGMVVLGRKIRTLIFSTDIALIRNCNADAVFAVYPFTPQQVISEAIINASSIPVFAGVGGGTTKGLRSVLMSQDAEAQGAYGVVVNSPMSNSNIAYIKRVIDIPVVATVVNEDEDIDARLKAGTSILNVAAGKRTADVVRYIRKDYPNIPIMASGGRTDDSIMATIEAGANSIVYTPPSTGEIFADMMEKYRTDRRKNKALEFVTKDTKDLVLDGFEDLVEKLHDKA